MPRSAASLASETRLSTETWNTPGMEAMGFRVSFP